jgi:hypothetical protein
LQGTVVLDARSWRLGLSQLSEIQATLARRQLQRVALTRGHPPTHVAAAATVGHRGGGHEAGGRENSQNDDAAEGNVHRKRLRGETVLKSGEGWRHFRELSLSLSYVF